MIDAESYRQYAADCVRKSEDEATPEGRVIMLNLGLAWLRLARQAEARLAGLSPSTVPTEADVTAGADPQPAR
jgi:hypothetical protein